MQESTSGFYADPTVYDILHTPGTGREVEILESLFDRHCQDLPRAGVWLEPACGSGRFLRLLTRHGHRVAGFDLSETMLSYARQRLEALDQSRHAHIFRADMTTFSSHMKPESVIFAFNTINSLRHLEHDEDFLAHFREMAQVLHPDGIYVVGISLSAYGREIPTEDSWEGQRGSCQVRQIVQYLPPADSATGARKERVISHLTIQRPRGSEHRDHSYDLHCFNRRQWRRLLLHSPLAIREITSDQGQPMQDHDGNYFLYILGHPR